MTLFKGAELEPIAGALGHTELGLTGREFERLVGACQMVGLGPITKARRLYNASAESQNSRQARNRILGFSRKTMAPSR